MEIKGERGRVGIGRLGLTHKHFGYCVQNRQLMGTYCIAHVLQLMHCGIPNAEITKGSDICVCRADYFAME